MTDKSTYTMIDMEITGKHGSQSISMSMDKVWSYLEQAVAQKNYQPTFVVRIMARNTSSSIYQEVVKSLANYTKQSKNSKMASYMIIDTKESVEILGAHVSSSLQTQNWTLVSCHMTDGVYTELVTGWNPDSYYDF